jgi:hypothetical protein
MGTPRTAGGIAGVGGAFAGSACLRCASDFGIGWVPQPAKANAKAINGASGVTRMPRKVP